MVPSNIVQTFVLMRKIIFAFLPCMIICACDQRGTAKTDKASVSNDASKPEDFSFSGGYPSDATVEKAYADLNLNRAIQMYRVFYQTVSGMGILKGNQNVGIIPNKVFGTMDTKPKHVGFTLNSDTPYGPVLLDLHEGPIVVEMPPGPLIGAALALNQDWIADLGIPGPFGDKGGKFLFLPPDYKGEIPKSGYHVAKSTTYILTGGLRAIPVGGNLPGALALLKTVKVYPLNKKAGWSEPKWIDLTPGPQDTSPYAWENNIQFWQELYEFVNSEYVQDSYRQHYGELAALGIEKGKPFNPDDKMKNILEEAARRGNAQMRVESFADSRPDRVVWADRRWEWASLRYEDGAFNTANFMDEYAREKWVYQAIGLSPAMFRRDAKAGSVYWLGLRDNNGKYLDGKSTYKLTIPLPVPAKLFWSVTVYDAETRSQIRTDQDKAALRSLFELKNKSVSGNTIDLYFGPSAPAGNEGEWIKTIPGKGWFVYFRVYGPLSTAFNGGWKPGDFEKVN